MTNTTVLALARAKATFERRLLEVQLMRVPEDQEPARQKALAATLAHYRTMLADIEKTMEWIEELPREIEYSADGRKVGIRK